MRYLSFPVMDFAAVKIDGLTAYIDQTGEVILQTEFENAGDFSEGLASFESEDEKYGYINKKR